MSNEVEKRYKEAVERIVEKLKADKNVTAVILFGSLSYDKVWEKSDVDMTVVVRDDQKLIRNSYCIDEDDIVINIDLVTRTGFVKWLNKAIGGLFSHSLLTRGNILFTRDESLYDALKETEKIGKSDMELAVFFRAESIVAVMQKCEKWIRIKNDETYARYYLLKLADAIACFEVCLNFMSPSREAVLQAAEINPDLMDRFYFYPMNNILNSNEILQLIQEADDYLVKHIEIVSKPLIEYLSDGEPKTVTAMSKHFKFSGHGLTHLTEYLKTKGVIEKSTETIRVTPKGRPVAEEIAYFYVKDGDGDKLLNKRDDDGYFDIEME